MSFARLTAAVLIWIVALLPAAARATQSFDAGRRPPLSLNFKHSFGSPADPVVVVRDSASARLAPPLVAVPDRQPLPASDEAVPPAPIVSTPDALRAPPAAASSR